ncbi:DUF418 domain-containing protein [Aquisalimonas sp. 2447]|uniref:DUF418 domain-containing protein n=1 Tax=Aquisalimonas sp. 2447 TaxID=2740807 RepID=UPI0014324D57|nr:DUF418 domain-containing protein [Aquisalimonas sp. 2447]QIT54093.1 DUF418 domain-containing protein [Aquisalimonas sp. 2447]
MTASPQRTDRIDSLDVLRGFAILGILVMNIQAFAMISQAYLNPTLGGSMTGMDFWIWVVSHVAFDSKFLALFAALFGAGMVIMAERAEAAGDTPWRLHRRRMGILALIGLIHAYGIWFGDILFIYAVIGVIAFAFRRASIRRLLVFAALFYAVPVIVGLAMTGMFYIMPGDEYDAMVQAYWQPSVEAIAGQQEAYRSGWFGQMAQRVPDAATLHVLALPLEEGWRVLALMLAGMAALKSGLLTGAWSAQRYAAAGLLGAGIGLPIVIAGVVFNQATGWEMKTSLYLGALFNHLGAPLVTLAWVCGALIVLKRGLWPSLLGRLRAVGQTALSCYLLTSVLCVTVFYGHGLGLFGQADRVDQLLIMFAVWAVLLTVAPAWLRRFEMGPVEWLWRWGVKGRKPALRRKAATG